MEKFSPTEAVFAGFRFARQRPAVLLIWSAYYLVVLAVTLFAVLDLGGDKVAALQAMAQSSTIDMAKLQALADDLTPAFGFASLLLLVFGAVLRTAILRVYMAKEPQAWAGLRLGGEELRVLGAYASMMAILAGALVVAMGVSAAVEMVSQAAGLPVLALGVLAAVALMVRLSLLPTVAYAERKVSPQRSWLLTRGVFWRLVAAFVLLFAVAAVIWMVLTLLFMALMGAAATATGGSIGEVGLAIRRQYEGLHPVLIVLDVLLNLLQVWLSVVYLTVGLGIGLHAWRVMSRLRPPGKA